MAFKNTYKLSGLEWCFGREKAEERGLAAKYRKEMPVRLIANKHNTENVNVFVEHQIVGFINKPESAQIIDALEENKDLFAKIHSVEDSDKESPIPKAVHVEVSTFPRRLHDISGVVKRGYVEPNNKIDKGEPFKRSRVLDAPKDHLHRILRRKFSAQRKKALIVTEHAGKIGIYCIWSKTHETYIGQSIDIGRRMYQHLEVLENGSHPNGRLQSDWSLGHARFRFDIVELVRDQKDLDHREEFYITKFQTYRYGYSSTPDGQGRAPYERAQPAEAGPENSEPEQIRRYQFRPTERPTPDSFNIDDGDKDKSESESGVFSSGDTHSKMNSSFRENYKKEQTAEPGPESSEPEQIRKYQFRPTERPTANSSNIDDGDKDKSESSVSNTRDTPSKLNSWFRANRGDFLQLFDGRYVVDSFQRRSDTEIVRIWLEDEVWCYLTDSEYHAQQVAKWFAGSRHVEGVSYDWHIKST